jgi:hypothetical protein
MVYLKKILNVLTWPYRYVRDEYRFKKRLKEMRKRDPFIYK